MGDFAIKVNNLTKVYKMYDKPIDRMKEALHPLRHQYHRDFYALRNVSFAVRKGEAIGILGRNGSGKSTLLKIISNVLTPTSGQVVVNGKVAALLELGAGFNVEMSGLENIYLSGMLIGYSKQEMNERLDDIINFADIGDHIYQPVKTYSSGMLVRLAFAVQTQVEPDILIVDEALAVGDALFQKRCFQKMDSLIQKGTTLLFVSHDQEMIRTMTNRAVLLSNGEVVLTGTSADVMLEYRRQLHEEEKRYWNNALNQLSSRSHETQQVTPAIPINEEESARQVTGTRSFGDLDAEVIYVRVQDTQNQECSSFYPKDQMKIIVGFKVNKDLKHLNIGIRIRNREGVKIYSWGTLNQDIDFWAQNKIDNIFWEKSFYVGQIYEVTFDTKVCLGPNLYEIQASITEERDRYYGSQRMLHWKDEAAFFRVLMKTHEYFFGGVVDLEMKSSVQKKRNANE